MGGSTKPSTCGTGMRIPPAVELADTLHASRLVVSLFSFVKHLASANRHPCIHMTCPGGCSLPRHRCFPLSFLLFLTVVLNIGEFILVGGAGLRVARFLGVDSFVERVGRRFRRVDAEGEALSSLQLVLKLQKDCRRK